MTALLKPARRPAVSPTGNGTVPRPAAQGSQPHQPLVDPYGEAACHRLLRPAQHLPTVMFHV